MSTMAYLVRMALRDHGIQCRVRTTRFTEVLVTLDPIEQDRAGFILSDYGYAAMPHGGHQIIVRRA